MVTEISSKTVCQGVTASVMYITWRAPDGKAMNRAYGHVMVDRDGPLKGFYGKQLYDLPQNTSPVLLSAGPTITDPLAPVGVAAEEVKGGCWWLGFSLDSTPVDDTRRYGVNVSLRLVSKRAEDLIRGLLAAATPPKPKAALPACRCACHTCACPCHTTR